jgi:sRNA-binding regulator protein Hfq
MKSLLYTLLLLPNILLSQSDSSVWIIRLGDYGQRVVIDYNGRELFRSRYKESFTTESKFPPLQGDFTYFETFDFASGYLPSFFSGETRLIDRHGQLVYKLPHPELEETAYPATGGIHRVLASGYYYYLDMNRQPKHGRKHYSKANTYGDGLAVVQEADSGVWNIIDRDEQVVSIVKGEIAKNIFQTGQIRDGRFVARFKLVDTLTWSERYCRAAFDTRGDIILSTKDLETHVDPYGSHSMEILNGGDIWTSINELTTVFDNNNEEILRINDHTSLRYSSSRCLWLNNRSQDYLYSADYKRINLEKLTGYKNITVDRITNDYLVLHVNAKDFYHADKYTIVLDTRSNKVVYKVEGIKTIADVAPNRIVLMRRVWAFYRFDKIIDFDGNLIYKEAISDYEFTEVRKAEESPDSVWHLSLTNKKELTDFNQFLNLSSLRIGGSDHYTLPDVSNCSKLKTLHLTHCDAHQLPTGLEETQLTHLDISQCDELEGLEDYIQRLPYLTYLRTSNYKFKEGFLTRIRKERPELTIKTSNY